MKPTFKQRLSNSSINKYLECGKKYQYHYIYKYRGPNKSSALIFGSAIDAGLNELVLKQGDGVNAFNNAWEYSTIETDVEEYIPDNPALRYADSDFDKDLLMPEDFMAIQSKSEELGLSEKVIGEDILKIAFDRKKQVGYNNMLEKEVRLFNLINWLSLKRKAPVMFEAYSRIVVPRIKAVHNVQKYVEMNSDDGDQVIGYIDLIVDYELDDGTVVKLIADNKTSTMEYAHDSVSKSQQLILYSIATGLNYGAFFVIRKQLNKNRTKKCVNCDFDGIKPDGKLTTAKTCDNIIVGVRCKGEWIETVSPTARVDIRIGEINQQQKSNVVDTIDQVNNGIKSKIFARNFNACNNFNQQCEFFEICHNNDDTGLIKKE